MGLLDKLLNGGNWDKVKSSGEAYPPEMITLLTYKTENGSPATGWIDMAYQNYKYKKYCPVNFLIEVNLNDDIAKKNPDIDFGTLEDYFLKVARKIGVAHLVARLATDDGIDMEMYVEKGQETLNHLWELSNSKDKYVTFVIDANEDPNWSAFKQLVKMMRVK